MGDTIAKARSQKHFDWVELGAFPAAIMGCDPSSMHDGFNRDESDDERDDVEPPEPPDPPNRPELPKPPEPPKEEPPPVKKPGGGL